MTCWARVQQSTLPPITDRGYNRTHLGGLCSFPHTPGRRLLLRLLLLLLLLLLLCLYTQKKRTLLGQSGCRLGVRPPSDPNCPIRIKSTVWCTCAACSLAASACARSRSNRAACCCSSACSRCASARLAASLSAALPYKVRHRCIPCVLYREG